MSVPGDAPLRAVLLDVDGTLYRQGPLRALMAAELAAAPLRLWSWSRATRVWRGLAAFRSAQEELRTAPPGRGIGARQLALAAERSGLDADELDGIVAEWMGTRPLRYLRALRRPGVCEFVTWATSRSVRIGVLSDYPAGEKLRALGIDRHVSVCLCATDADIDALKPRPEGFLHAARALGLDSREVLYVGDRHAVDAVGARAAGMRCAIVGGRVPDGDEAWSVGSFAELRRAIEPCLAD